MFAVMALNTLIFSSSTWTFFALIVHKMKYCNISQWYIQNVKYILLGWFHNLHQWPPSLSPLSLHILCTLAACRCVQWTVACSCHTAGLLVMTYCKLAQSKTSSVVLVYSTVKWKCCFGNTPETLNFKAFQLMGNTLGINVFIKCHF